MKSAKTNKNYYNKTAEKWATEHNTANFWGEYMTKFKDLLPKESKLLEIGAGAGRDAKELIEFGYDYTGIEPAIKLLEIAQIANPDGTFVNYSIEEFTTSTFFDGFWASASLLHIFKNDIVKVLVKIKSLMNHGAVGFISLKKLVDNEPAERQIIDEDGARYFTYWTEREFREVLDTAGFELITETYEFPMSEKTVWLIYYVRTK